MNKQIGDELNQIACVRFARQVQGVVSPRIMVEYVQEEVYLPVPIKITRPNNRGCVLGASPVVFDQNLALAIPERILEKLDLIIQDKRFSWASKSLISQLAER